MNARDIPEKKANEREARREALEQERRVAELVRRSERELADFFDNATIAMHWVGPDGTILRANKTELDLLGYGRSEYVGRHLAEFHVDRPVIDDILARLTRGENLHEYAARLRCKDGSIRDVLINSSSLFENGRFVHSRCFTQDVTERKRTEEALRHSQAQLEMALADTKLLQSVSSELVREKDTSALYGKIIDAAVAIMRSDFASMQMLYPERGKSGEMRLLAFRGFNPQAAQFWEWVRADSNCTCGIALRTGRRVIEPDVAKSGIMAGTQDQATYLQTGIRAVQSTPLFARDGRLVGMISTHWRQPHQPSNRDLRLLDILARQAADLIESKRDEQELGKLAAIIETSGDSIISTDLDSNITSWNRGAERLFGYTAQEAIGRPITMLMPPDKVDEEPANLKRIRHGEHIDPYETVRRRKDGTLVDISLSVSPIVMNGNGEAIGASRIARDITDRKRVEDARRESSRQLRETLDAMPAPVYTTDAQGRLTYFNRAAAEVAGRAPQLGIDQWCMSWKMRYPDGRLLPHDECPMTVAIKEDRPVRGVELIVERPDGTQVPCMPYPTPLHDAQGRLSGAVNMVLDLTEAKRAEHVAGKFATIVESSDDAIISKDLNGIIDSWNKGAERLFGYTAQEAIGQPVTMLMLPDKVDEEPGILQRIRRGERIDHYETVRRRKDGTLVDISLSVSPIVDGTGKIVGASKIARDITDRRRAEEALLESEKLFRMLCDHAPTLIWFTDASGCDFVNRSYLDFVGASLPDVRGSGWTRYLPPDEREQYIGRFLAAAERRELFVSEHRFRRADGIYRQMKTVGVPRLSPTGDLLGYVGSTYDITDVKEAEDVLRDAARRKDEFLAMLSHELRNPLAPMRHAVTLLQQVDDEEIRRQASGILDRQIGHMTRLVEDLLDISRITRGDINVYKREVDLAAVVQAAIETSRPLVEGSGHRLDITLPETPVSVVADQQRLAQVVSNLLNNAARYTPRGGRIGLEVSRAPDAAAISVRDNGIGIPADELPRLFGMFTQLDSARGRAPGGLGIGLALARRLVELHGGTIEARSEGPGRGSEFTVRIPLTDKDLRSGASA